MATPRLGLVVEDKPTELSCIYYTPFTVPQPRKLGKPPSDELQR